MPCYQVITSSVEFKIGNFAFIKKAIEKLGYKMTGMSEIESYLSFRDDSYNQISINLKTQKITGQLDQEKLSSIANTIKRSYSEVVLDEIAKRQHWIKKNLGNNSYQLQRF